MIQKCFTLLSKIYDNTERGDELYKVFINLIRLFQNVSPALRTELFLQLIIYTNHSTKCAKQRGEGQGVAVFRSGVQLRRG